MKKIKVRAQVKSFAFWNTAKKKNYSIFRAPPGRIHSFSQPLSSADGRRSSSLRRFQNTSWFSATSDSCWIHTKTVNHAAWCMPPGPLSTSGPLFFACGQQDSTISLGILHHASDPCVTSWTLGKNPISVTCTWNRTLLVIAQDLSP